MEDKNQRNFLTRRYGVELEYCSFDLRDFDKNPLVSKEELPIGTKEMAHVIMKSSDVPVVVDGYHITNDNKSWVLKPDRSCGIEVCSPVFSGSYGLNQVETVINAIRAYPDVKIDNRCGFHLHVSVADLGTNELSFILAWWVKTEMIFLDSVPDYRKCNRYCKQLGHNSEIHIETFPDELIGLLSSKYNTLNTYHYNKGTRSTIEFRIGEELLCMSGSDAAHWVKLLLYFTEIARQTPVDSIFNKMDTRNGLRYLDFNDFMSFMSFDENVNPEIIETRDWFIGRLIKNIDSKLDGIWSSEYRQVSKKQLLNYINNKS